MSTLTRTGQLHDVEVLDSIANTLIEENAITASDLVTTWQDRVIPANEGWSGKVEQAALVKARMLSPEILGRIIVARPDASLYSIHCGTWLDKYESGPSLLQQIAATAVVVRIRELVGIERLLSS